MSGYTLPVSNGNYTVRLHFAETYQGIHRARQRIFGVNVEGIVIENIDIFDQTGGRNIALVKTLTVPVSDNVLNINFIPSVQEPEINGIEVISTDSSVINKPTLENVLIRNDTWDSQKTFYTGDVIRLGMNGNVQGPEPVPVTLWWKVVDAEGNTVPELSYNNFEASIGPGFWGYDFSPSIPTTLSSGQYVFRGELHYNGKVQQLQASFTVSSLALRIEAGGNADYSDSIGHVWTADTGFIGGTTVDRGDISIANTTIPRIYQTERYGMAAYALPLSNGNYVVRLHFAETYSGITNSGQRVFSVNAEGTSLNNIDIFAETGGRNIALIKTINVVVNDSQLDIKFIASVQNAEINGIEVLPN